MTVTGGTVTGIGESGKSVTGISVHHFDLAGHLTVYTAEDGKPGDPPGYPGSCPYLRIEEPANFVLLEGLSLTARTDRAAAEIFLAFPDPNGRVLRVEGCPVECRSNALTSEEGYHPKKYGVVSFGAEALRLDRSYRRTARLPLLA